MNRTVQQPRSAIEAMPVAPVAEPRSWMVRMFAVFGTPGVFLAAGIPMMVLPSVAAGSMPAPTVITSCVGNVTGITRIVSSPNFCLKNYETVVQWNAAGAAGAQGVAGAAGAQGVAGMAGVAGPSGPAGADGATGAPGPAGASGGQLWSASFSLPAELNVANLQSGWNRIVNIGSQSGGAGAGKISSSSFAASAIASPSGSSNAVLSSSGSANTAKAFLMVPATCTASNLNVYVAGAQTTAYGATISVATADPINDTVQSPNAPEVNPNVSQLSCQIVAGQNGTANPSMQQCASPGTAATLLTAGQMVTIEVMPSDTSDAMVNLQVMSSFNCDTTNTTGAIAIGTPAPGGWNRVKNLPDSTVQ